MLHRDAHELDPLGNIADAEPKFREALAGLEALLSPTHEDTNTVAYRLAAFYAQHDRIRDAECSPQPDVRKPHRALGD